MRGRGTVAGWLGALAFGAAVGCGDGSSIPFSQFEPSAEQGVCHLLVLCGEFSDQATCLASVQVEPHYYDTLGQDIDSGKVVYDGTKARACVDFLNGLSTCNRTGLPSVDLDANCNSIFTGTVAVGGACFFKEECAGGGACQPTGTSCDPSGQCCPGTCIAVAAPVGAGGACPASPATCASGTICLLDPSGTATCQATVGLGAACGLSPCANTLYCDSTSGTCKAPVGTGGACNPVLDSQDCDGANDRCSVTTSVCTPLLSLGSPCDPATNGCVTYAICDATTSTCVERPGVGAACDTTGAGPPCLAGSCDATTATCTLTPTAGACS